MGLNYKNILVAVDGSENADWAFTKAIEMAKQNKADLHIVHVFEYRIYPADLKTLRKRAEDEGHQLLANYKKRAKDEGIEKANVILKLGSPKELISRKIAKEVGADVIVVGASGLFAFEQRILGSVTDSIIRTAKCDVLVVRDL